MVVVLHSANSKENTHFRESHQDLYEVEAIHHISFQFLRDLENAVLYLLNKREIQFYASFRCN